MVDAPEKVTMLFSNIYTLDNPMRAIELAREFLVTHRGFSEKDARETINRPDDALEELLPMCPWALVTALDEENQPRLAYLRKLVEECDTDMVDIYERETVEDGPWNEDNDDIESETTKEKP